MRAKISFKQTPVTTGFSFDETFFFFVTPYTLSGTLLHHSIHSFARISQPRKSHLYNLPIVNKITHI
jgi:hypothetical protein